MSFCDIQFKRNKDSIEVTNKNGYPSKLYPKIVEVVKPQSDRVYQNGKSFFDTLIEQGKLMNTSPNELSLGLYSLAYNSDQNETYWIDNINSLLPKGSNVEPPQNKASDTLKDLAVNGVSKDIRLTAKRLLDSVSKNDAPILDKRNMKEGELQYNLFKNEIYVNAEEVRTIEPEDYQRGILHEIVHSLTINPLISREKELRNSAFFKDVKKIVSDLERRVPVKQKDDIKFYAFQHEDEDIKIFEFIAEYLSKKEFADWVDARLTDKKSFIEKLVAFIANVIFGKKILESAIFDYIENRFTFIPMSKNQYKEVLMNEMSSFVNTEDSIKSDLKKIMSKFGKKFGKNQTIIDPNADYGSLVKSIAAINSEYPVKVVEIYKAPDGTDRVRIIKDNLNKAALKVKEDQMSANKKENEIEIQKEDTSRMVDSIPELSFLSEDEKFEAERLLQSGQFNIYCGL